MDSKLALLHSVLDPIKSHVHGFGSSDLGALVGKSVCGGLIGGDAGGAGLFVAHGFEDVAHVCCFLAVVVRKRALVSASDAAAMTFFMILLSKWTGPLGLRRSGGSSLRPS